MDAITLGFSCLNVLLCRFPQIVNILLTIWTRAGSLLLQILPLTLYASLTCLVKTVLSLIQFEVSSITFILTTPISHWGSKSSPPIKEVAGSTFNHEGALFTFALWSWRM